MNSRPAALHLVAAINDRRLRVERSDRGVVLPQINGDEGWCDPPQILDVAQDARGMIMVPAVLIEADPRSMLHVVAVAEDSRSGEWIELDDLDQLAHPPAVAEAILRSVAEYRGSLPRPAGRPEWFDPDWQVGVDAWIDGALHGTDVVRRGPSEVRNFWSLSAVERVPVTGIRGDDAVFFKAACPWFRTEPALTQFVAGVAGRSVPELIAVDTERGWMLMRAFELDDHERNTQAGVPAAREIARLQVILADRIDELLDIGAPDRRLANTVEALTKIITESVELDQLSADDQRAARSALPLLVDQLTALEATGMPYSLGHGDLHLGNVTLVDDHVVLFDWTDAAVTFPVLDVALLAQSSGVDDHDAVLDAYASIWRESHPAADVDEALRLAPLANQIYQAISYEAIYRAQEERTRWEMGGVVARILRSLVQQWRANTQRLG